MAAVGVVAEEVFDVVVEGGWGDLVNDHSADVGAGWEVGGDGRCDEMDRGHRAAFEVGVLDEEESPGEDGCGDVRAWEPSEECAIEELGRGAAWGGWGREGDA